MFSRAIVGLLVGALGVVAQSSTTANKPFALATPEQLVQCKNTTIVWQGGEAPFRVTITPECDAGKTGSQEEHIISTPGATSFKLPIKYPAGTKIVVGISDSSNMQASAPSATIVSGNADDSCAVQTACPNNIQAPNAPVALASSSSGTAVPTGNLVTNDPSATSTATASPTATTSLSMVILYTYVPEPTPTKGPSSVASGSNAAVFSASTSVAAILGALASVGFCLILDY